MGGFFKRGEIVTIDGGSKRWSVDGIRESRDRDGEPYQMADLSDVDGGKTSAATERLTKVGG